MLKIVNYSKQYENGKLAVNNLSLTVEKGDIYAFIGHNGAGKTTTIKSVVGILPYNDGDIYVNGYNIKDNSMECKKIIAYIPDNPDIYENMTGNQYLNFISDVYKLSKKERTEKINYYANLFEFSNELTNMIYSYSHGMKQKLCLISAFIRNPKLLILDEPFVGLDPNVAFIFKNAMKEFCEKGGSIFFSTHVLEIAEKLCNKVAIIKDGKLVAQGLMEDITKNKDLEEVFLELNNA